MLSPGSFKYAGANMPPGRHGHKTQIALTIAMSGCPGDHCKEMCNLRRRAARYGSAMTAAESSDTAGELFAEIAGMLAAVAGVDDLPVAPDVTLEGDLGLDSLDVADLAGRLHERYGVDLLAFLATLDIDELVGLTAGGLTEHVAGAAA
jgi:acyl carrier protein